jgi:hypothetical protein
MQRNQIEKTVQMPHMGLKGMLRVQVVNPDGSLDWDSGEFSNLILDQGLDEIANIDTTAVMEH